MKNILIAFTLMIGTAHAGNQFVYGGPVTIGNMPIQNSTIGPITIAPNNGAVTIPCYTFSTAFITDFNASGTKALGVFGLKKTQSNLYGELPLYQVDGVLNLCQRGTSDRYMNCNGWDYIVLVNEDSAQTVITTVALSTANWNLVSKNGFLYSYNGVTTPGYYSQVLAGDSPTNGATNYSLAVIDAGGAVTDTWSVQLEGSNNGYPSMDVNNPLVVNTSSAGMTYAIAYSTLIKPCSYVALHVTAYSGTGTLQIYAVGK